MTTAAPTLESLTKDFGELQSKYLATAEELAKLKAAPDLTGIHRDSEGRITGYMEETDESMEVISPVGFRNNTRKAYKALRRRHVGEMKSFGYKPWGEFKSFGEMVRAGFEGAPSFESRLGTHLKAIQGMSTTAGSDGGYTVLPEFAPGIIDRVYANDLFSLTDNYSVSGNNMTFLTTAETSRATGSRAGGVQGYWLGEGATITKSKPTLRELTLKLVKLAAVVYLTDELIQDGGTALEAYVTKKVAEEFNFMIGDALFNGTGVGQPLGLLNSPSLVSVAKETGQAATTLYPENVVKMHARFYGPNLPGARWFKNQDVDPQLHLMTLGIGAAGEVVYMPPGGLSASPYATLMGKPVQNTEFNATLGTQGDIVLADFGQVLSISKGGIVQAVSMHIEFLTDQLALRFTMRTNARPWEDSPITPYKGTANTQANFIALDIRS